MLNGPKDGLPRYQERDDAHLSPPENADADAPRKRRRNTGAEAGRPDRGEVTASPRSYVKFGPLTRPGKVTEKAPLPRNFVNIRH